MIRVGKQNKFGVGCRLLQSLGVRNTDLDVPLPLDDEHRFAEGRDQLSGIVGEFADEKSASRASIADVA
jgi:hypothetical protein